MTKRLTFEYITKIAESAAGMGARDTVLFTYFNPNGAYQMKMDANDAINKAIADGVMRNGAYFAYGCMNDYYEKALQELFQMTRPRWSNVRAVIHGLKTEAAKAQAKAKEAREAGRL